MEKIRLFIETKDAESPAQNRLSIEWQEATQENLNVIAGKVKEIAPVMEGLTDNDTVTAAIEIVDIDNPEINAMAAVNNVSKARAISFMAMVEAAFQSHDNGNGEPAAENVTEQKAEDTTAAATTTEDVAAATTVADGNAKEGDEQ